MAREGFVIRDDKGNEEFVYYDEIDPELLPKLLKPQGCISWSAEAFKRLPLVETPFYITPWLPMRGKAMIYAPAKAGKSFLCLQIARCIGSGQSFLGLPVVQGRVLYAQFELGAEVLQKRLQSTEKTYDDVFVATTFSMKLDTEAGQKQLLGEMEAVKPQVLILDPFYKILKGDENESIDVRGITDFLDNAIIDAYGCSVLLIHHPGKDITKGGRGSSVLEDWVDSQIEMRRVSKEGEPLQIKLTAKLLRHANTPPEPIIAQMENYEFDIVDADAKTVKERVFKFVKNRHKAGQTTTTAGLLDEGVGSRKSVFNSLDDLVREGAIERVRRGEYNVASPPAPVETIDTTSVRRDKIKEQEVSKE